MLIEEKSGVGYAEVFALEMGHCCQLPHNLAQLGALMAEATDGRKLFKDEYKKIIRFAA